MESRRKRRDREVGRVSTYLSTCQAVGLVMAVRKGIVIWHAMVVTVSNSAAYPQSMDMRPLFVGEMSQTTSRLRQEAEAVVA